MKKKNGWVPDQHGAWVMVLVPIIVGVILRPSWIQVPLFIAWMSGYFAFFALSLFLKVRSPRRRRYVPALGAYGGVSACFSLAIVLLQPSLLWFAFVFGPLVAVAVWEAYRRRPRSLLSGISTVLASCAMLPVAFFAAGGNPRDVWVPTLIMAMYFCGTIPYVKTLIRKKGDAHWLFGSVAYHILCVIAMAILFAIKLSPWWGIVIFALFAFRAWWVPHSAGSRRAWSPRDIGIGEMFSTAALLAIVFAVSVA
ncbi:YwiC-like family protein [Corynebacterium freiburgense]|uniref:YwiC-like family protein n=1 Tax=Corynebacterium freiburgense TaxID=556548 RepID=UPI00047B136D|nr:YwiC-like family protein [Corynebacterium freiburgense]WJZ03519.1 hypothetical protein CFREI_11255 [Corynebacterium freiburgense]